MSISAVPKEPFFPPPRSGASLIPREPQYPPPGKESSLRPRYLLPDSSLLFVWGADNKLVEQRSTKDFCGICGIYREIPPEEKFLVVLDWYNTLSRSKTESAEAVKRVPWENLELLKRLTDKFQNRIVFAICSYISASQSNLTSLVEACNSTEGLSSLISFVVVTRSKVGSHGKKAAIEALAQRKAPTALVDDNSNTIAECESAIFTIHLKLRGKPSARRAGAVKEFVEECGELIEEKLIEYIPNWQKNREHVRVRRQD